MLMLYDSDNYTVLQFGHSAAGEAPVRGGYEIVDKFARKEIFLDGLLAERFRAGVQALVEQHPSEEEIDAYISRFGALAQQPVVLH